MKKMMHKLWVKFITCFGCIKVFKYPMFIVYDPSTFKMDGMHIIKALKSLQPGDILLRGFDNYLDGYFIDDPHGYSHGAIYAGDYKVIHAVAKGVSEIDVIDFMKCDRICILRPSKDQQKAIEIAKKFAKDNVPYDFNFKVGSSAVYCFELCALCYPDIEIKKFKFSKMLGLLKRTAYLADSFRENTAFKTVFEFNLRCGVDK